MKIAMKSTLLAGSFALALTVPAFAENAADHGAHHPAAATSTPAAPPATQPATAAPGGMMMNCPMMAHGQATAGEASTATPDQRHMGGGGQLVPMPNAQSPTSTQGAMMDKDKMMQCPMMQTPGAPTGSNNSAPATTGSDAHDEHH